jgi:hypothetical protein
MIVGVCGFIGSGKDTVADYLVNFHEFRRESFANTLKDAVSNVFGWDRTMLEGRTKQAREWREQVDPWWSNRLNMPELTPRLMLQLWGTEVCRKGFHDDIWIASLENKLRASQDNVVISDCRFPNEIASIRSAGGKIIWVRRGQMPDWYDTAIAANQGHNVSTQELKRLKIHASETAWVGTEFDAIIDNNDTIDELYSQIKNLVLDRPVSIAHPLSVAVSDSLHIQS